MLSIQTHGAQLDWKPQIQAHVTDGGFLHDSSFVPLPLPDTDVLAEVSRRSVPKLFVHQDLFEPEVAAHMLFWMHSGCSVDGSVWFADGDTRGHDRLAHYLASGTPLGQWHAAGPAIPLPSSECATTPLPPPSSTHETSRAYPPQSPALSTRWWSWRLS